MTDPIKIPSLGFSRGAVVRQGDGPNMIVVRGFRDRTACVFCAGDHDGTLRLLEFDTNSLRQMLPAATPMDEDGR